jgi:uncharacterized protein (TIGR03086 family)
MDLNTALDQALAATGRIVAGIKPAQLEASTPCPDFTVKALLDHVVGVNQMFFLAARDKKVDVSKMSGAGDDPASAFDLSAKEASEAWKAPGILEEQVELPFGTFPGAVALNMFISETVVHGWDVAKATGQSTEIDTKLAEVSWEAVKDLPDAFRGGPGSGMPFGPKVEAPAGASPGDRLIAHMGRQP